MTPLAVGASAPDFEFFEGGAAVRLSARARERGAFVLFVPLAGAPVCASDVKQLAAAAGELGAPQRPLVVVSVDRSEHLRRFLDENGAAALAHREDRDLALAAAFGVKRPEGFAARASFLIGPDGKVAAGAIHSIGFPRPLELLKSWLASAPPAASPARA